MTRPRRALFMIHSSDQIDELGLEESAAPQYSLIVVNPSLDDRTFDTLRNLPQTPALYAYYHFDRILQRPASQFWQELRRIFKSGVHDSYLYEHSEYVALDDTHRIARPVRRSYETLASFINYQTRTRSLDGVYIDGLTQRFPLSDRLKLADRGIGLGPDYDRDRAECAGVLLGMLNHSVLANTGGWTHPMLEGISLEMKRPDGSERFSEMEAGRIFSKQLAVGPEAALADLDSCINVAWYSEGVGSIAMAGDVES